MSAIKQEKDNIKIIKENNSEGTDSMLINDCIKNHFFMRALDAKTRYKLSNNNIIFLEGA